MRYKAEYKPSELLDCMTNSWIDLACIKELIEQGRYFDFSSDRPQPPPSKVQFEKAEIATADDEQSYRIPDCPQPPPGIKKLVLSKLKDLISGKIEADTELELLSKARTLEASRQSEGIKPFLVSAHIAHHI
jgi:arginine-tRNA-protein transferase